MTAICKTCGQEMPTQRTVSKRRRQARNINPGDMVCMDDAVGYRRVEGWSKQGGEVRITFASAGGCWTIPEKKMVKIEVPL